MPKLSSRKDPHVEPPLPTFSNHTYRRGYCNRYDRKNAAAIYSFASAPVAWSRHILLARHDPTRHPAPMLLLWPVEKANMTSRYAPIDRKPKKIVRSLTSIHMVSQMSVRIDQQITPLNIPCDPGHYQHADNIPVGKARVTITIILPMMTESRRESRARKHPITPSPRPTGAAW